MDELWPAANVLGGNYSPVAAVLSFVSIVPHHEVVARRDEQRPPGVELGLLGGWAKTALRELDLVLPLEQLRVVGRLRAARRRPADDAETLSLLDAIHAKQPVTHEERVAGHADEALHERGRGILVACGLVRLVGRDEHHDIAALRLAERGKVH